MEQNQELLFKFSMFEQQIKQLQQQLQAIEDGIMEMNGIDFGLDDIVGSINKEILSPIGRGIFVKTKLISEELVVDIGEKTFVKKTIPETKKIIKKQIEKLDKMKTDLDIQLDNINKELTKTMTEAQEKKK